MIVFGRWHLEDRPFAKGGMGEVYKVVDRPLAVKRLPRALTSDADYRARFLREQRVLQGVRHHHVVSVIESDEYDGELYICMEHLNGGSLEAQLRPDGARRRVALDPSTAIQVIKQMAEALDYVHRRGIVHRDVKPANMVYRRKGGDLVLIDFGIAREIDGTRVTATSAAVGTVAYMGPEVLAGTDNRTDDLSFAADRYALTVVLFELLAGRLPFPAGRWSENPEPVPSLATFQPRLGTSWDAVMQKGMHADPAQRYPSGAALFKAAQTVHAHQKSQRPVRRRMVLGAALAVTVGIGIAIGVDSWNRSAPPPPPAAVVAIGVTDHGPGAFGDFTVPDQAVLSARRESFPLGSAFQLYAVRPGGNECDQDTIAAAVEDDPALRDVWVRELGGSPTQLRDVVTPVLLRTDTRVGRHEVGAAVAREVVLQAGTAVLIDRLGLPVTRCRDGNPLVASTGSALPPDLEAWDGFVVDDVVAVQPAGAVQPAFLVYRDPGAERVSRPSGTSGARDLVVP